MVRKTCENVDTKRELLYSFSTLVFTPLLHYLAVTSAFSSGTSPSSWNTSPPTDPPPEEVVATGAGGTPPPSLPLSSQSLPIPENPNQNENNLLNVSTSFGNDLVFEWIAQRRILPLETVLYVFLFEILKLIVVFTVFPGFHLFDPTPGLSSMWSISGGAGQGGINGGKCAQVRLPFSKRDRDNGVVKPPNLQMKMLEIWKGVCNYLIGCAICHGFVVLLGAPVIENCKVTFQFCVILATWLLAPMCLAVQPSRLLQEIMFINLWNSENEILYRTKWRFICLILGAWAGAVVIPLDWDRPWQKWPIPCLTSTLLTYLISNLVLTIHLFCINFGVYHKLSLISSESNKIKNF